MDTEELEALDLLHYSPLDVNSGVLGPPFPVVHDQLLCLDDVERERVLSWHHTARSLTSSLWAVSLATVIRPTKVVWSANLMMVLKLYTAMQS